MRDNNLKKFSVFLIMTLVAFIVSTNVYAATPGVTPFSVTDNLIGFKDKFNLTKPHYTETPSQLGRGGPCSAPIYVYVIPGTPPGLILLPGCQIEQEYKEPVALLEATEITGTSLIAPNDDNLKKHQDKLGALKGKLSAQKSINSNSDNTNFYETRVWGIGPKLRKEYGANDWQFNRSYVCDVVDDHNRWKGISTDGKPVESRLNNTLDKLSYNDVVGHLNGWNNKFGGDILNDSVFGKGDEYLTTLFYSENDNRKIEADDRIAQYLPQNARAWVHNAKSQLSACEKTEIENAKRGIFKPVDKEGCIGNWGHEEPSSGFVSLIDNSYTGMALTAWRAYEIAKKSRSYHYVKKHNTGNYKTGIEMQIVHPYNSEDNFYGIGSDPRTWENWFRKGPSLSMDEIKNRAHLQTSTSQNAAGSGFVSVLWKNTYCCYSVGCKYAVDNPNWKIIESHHWLVRTFNWR